MRDTVRVEDTSAPQYRVPDDIAWIDGTEIGLREELYLSRLPSGATVQLTGTARIIWHSARRGVDAVSEVSRLTERPAVETRREIESFLERLSEARLIEAGACRAALGDNQPS